MYRAAGLAAIAGILSLSAAQAQAPAAPAAPPATTITDLSPVTDAMLANPDPADWLDVAPHARQLGLQPARGDRPPQRRSASARLDRGRSPTAIRKARRSCTTASCIFPNPIDITQAFDAATGDFIWEYGRSVPEDVGEYFPRRWNESQSRDLRQPDSRQRRRRLRLRARTRAPASSFGRRSSSTTARARRTARGRSSRTAR